MRGSYSYRPPTRFQLPRQRNTSFYILVGILVVIAIWVIAKSPTRFLGWLIGLMIGFSVHEWAHAYTALRLGDRTAYNQGRVTLDPRAHLDPIGFVLALTAGFGWARPVPVNPRAFYPNERQGLMLTALAGPFSNLVLAAIFGVIFRILNEIVPYTSGDVAHFFHRILAEMVIFNLGLMFFNLIPLSPLDGWKIMMGLLPPETAMRLDPYEQQSTLILILLLTFGIVNDNLNILSQIISPPVRAIFELVMGVEYIRIVLGL